MTTMSRWNDIAPGRRRTAWLVLAAAAVLLLLVSVPVGLRALGGGSSGASSSAASAGSGGSIPAQDAPSSLSDSTAAGGSGAGAVAGSAPATRSPMVAPKLARSAWLGLEVTDLSTSSAKARSVAAEAGGSVTYENVVTGTGPGGDSPGASSRPEPTSPGIPAENLAPVGVDEARLTLSVPAPRLDGVLTDLARLGTVSYRSSQAQDVTATYVDTQARIDPAKASVARVQALLADATDLKQVVLIESELSKRQADLDSLTGRLAQLDQQTTMSDVTLTLWTAATAPAASGNFFVDNLKKAWNGMLGSITVIVAGLATLLPWLVVLGLLAWAGMRLRRRHARDSAGHLAPTSGPPIATAAQPKE